MPEAIATLEGHFLINGSSNYSAATDEYISSPFKGRERNPAKCVDVRVLIGYNSGNHGHFFGPWQAQPQRAAWAVRRAVSIGPTAATWARPAFSSSCRG